MRCIFIISLFLLVIKSNGCYAQKNYRFETITVDNGLSQSGILCMVQDKFGFLWIGTQDGLNKYDGYSFKVFRHIEGDSTSLPKNFITNVLIDHDNNLWVGTIGYLSKYDIATGAFKNYRIEREVLPNHAIRILQCRDNSFAITNDEELFFFNPKTEKFFSKEEFKSLKSVRFYQETRNSGDWIFADKTLHKPQGQSEWREVDVNGYPYYHESNGQLMLNNGKNLLKFNNQSNSWDEFIKPSGNVMVLSNGDLWVGFHDGIRVYDSFGKLKQQIPADAIVLGSTVTFVANIYETRDGVVWLGTSGYGLKKYNPQTNRFGYVGASPNAAVHLSHSYVDAIYTSDDTTLYVSTPAGLDIINLMKNTSQHLPSPTRITRMTKDDTGTLWCNAWEYLYMLKNNRFIKVGDWEDFRTTDLQPEQVNILWLSENLKKGGSAFKELLLPELLSGDSLWINHSGVGAYIKWIDLTITNINTGKIIQSFKYDPANPTSAPRSETIKIIFQDSQKNIWVGSNSEGLCLYNPKQKNFRHFTEKDGLPNNVVYGILEDDTQHLWLSTNKGLCEFNPRTGNIRNFDIYDGLQSNEFNTGAFFKSSSGTMYFGGVNGLTYFHPKDVITSTSIPLSAITGFYVNNNLLKDYSDYVREDEKKKQILTLQYNERDFAFDIVGIGFSLPGRSHYRYMLENYDNQWHDIGNLQHVSFTNIPPGEYLFKVQSSDPYGNWERSGAAVQVIIQAPFWRNPWAWVFSGLTVFGITLSGYYIRVIQLKNRTATLEKIVDDRTQEIQQKKEEIAAQNEELLQQASSLEQQNRALEKAKGLLEIEVKYLHQKHLLESNINVQEAERKRIAQDLHDELGAVLSIARMHLVQMQDQNTNGIGNVEALQQARTLTETALATMRRISHELMPPQLEKFGLVKTLEAIATQINKANKITLDFISFEEMPRSSMAIELGLYRICMEMINNTLKHAGAKLIQIRLDQENDYILFSYCDDGCGLPENYNEGLGFKTIEARLSALGGKSEIGKNELGGYYAVLRIPMS